MKFAHIFRNLTVALVLALLITALPATPALAAEVITLNTYQGSIGQQITITGTGFSYPETGSRGVVILFGKDNPGAIVDYATDIYEEVKVAELYSDGTFSTTFQVPTKLTSGTIDEAVTSGTYYIYATYYYPDYVPPLKGTTVASTTTFTVLAAEISIDPDEGKVGTEVEIDGEGFGDREDITVEYDGREMDIESGDDDTDSDGDFKNTMIIVPPSAAGDHTITVIGEESDIEAEVEFTVEPEITINPESGAAGSTITVSGTGFGDEVDVGITFDGEGAKVGTTDDDGSFTISFAALSRAAGSYYIEAEDDDNNSDKASFTITVTTFNISPTTGKLGTEVAVSGSGFRANYSLTITFADVNVTTTTTDANGNFSTSFTVPVPTVGTYKVEVSDGITTRDADFSILISGNINPETSATSPGHVGTGITISGTGFIAGRTVSITYDGNQVATTTVNTNGSFSAAFDAPTSKDGGHIITATDGTNTEQFAFIMESTPPPTPRPLKPNMDIKAKAEAYFDWEDVIDPSGVTYTLQIATDENFSQASIVLEKTGLTQSEYTIAKADRLQSVSKDAPYYWHVKAVDGASNESQWTGTGRFYVGFAMSISQPIIYTIIGIAAFLFAVFAFWLGRKTAYY